MMMGLHFMDEVPFKDVYIHALVRDAQGQKMSKSKGNVIDPLTVIDAYGTDAFRFTLAAFTAQGRDIKLAEERIAGYRNFANKIWNASRFAMMNLEGFDPASVDPASLKLSNADKWILFRLNEAAASVEENLTTFKFNDAASDLYRFTWSEFCDWYIELIKDDLYKGDSDRQLTAKYVLWLTLENLLRLLHPFMPFITEEIWQALPRTGEEASSIMIAPFPKAREEWAAFAGAAAEMELVMEVIKGIRNIRGEMEVPPSKQIATLLDCKSRESLELLKKNEVYVMSLTRLSDLAIGQGVERPAEASLQVAGDVEIIVPLKGLVNVEEEEKRLNKEIAKIEKDIEFLSKKLQNPSFVERAPADVVEKEREKVGEFENKKKLLEENLVKIQRLR
jgi:valyl-tRNA synthetase